MTKGILIRHYLSRFCDDLDNQKPRYLTPDEVMTALWPLNQLFQSDFKMIKQLPYQPSLEQAADDAIVRFTDSGSWIAVSTEVKRVLQERHSQALMALMIQSKNDPQMAVMPVPNTLPTQAITGAVLLLLIHGMTLPFPVRD